MLSFKAIIFDYFGVLSSEVAPIWLQKNITTGDSLALKDMYVTPADKGMLSEKKLFDQLSVVSGIPAQQIPKQWSELIHVNDELLSFIQEELVGKYKLGILTNATSEFFHNLLAQHPLDSIFDAIVISSEIGHAKPEPEAYLNILEKLKIQPQDALMIDDNKINVDGAKAAGLNGLLFTSNENLRKELGF
jgi:HAD superfamily hydrolase (TIGR01509 family)